MGLTNGGHMTLRDAIDQIIEEPAWRPVSPLLGLLIFFFPILFVWLLLREGHTIRARIIGFAWLAISVTGTAASIGF